MNAALFWQEEIRCFPHGCRFCSLWVLRRDHLDFGAPLRLLLQWSRGAPGSGLQVNSPPLGAVMRTLDQDREALSFPSREAALWVEPVRIDGKPMGALALLFEADETWREGVFLWGQRLAARLASVLPHLDPVVPVATGHGLTGQLDLFSAPGPDQSNPPCFMRKKMNGLWGQTGISLPRPLMVPGIPGAIGVSEEMARLGRILPDVANSGANVLLRGESGTGKEVVAVALHAASQRCQKNFVGQNCAALPEALFESELFGHAAGAFTGAKTDKKGLLVAADKGTFFLDEIGDMPLALQIKLLRVMQERKVRRIGDLSPRAVDIRFIAATHRDLRQEIESGRFRLDLYYRLKVVSLDIPPLRDRPEDILHLLAYFLLRLGRPVDRMTIAEDALSALHAWNWPGNVRELENEVQRMSALYPGQNHIRRDYFSQDIAASPQRRIQAQDLGVLRNMSQACSLLEQYLIRKAIAASGGRKAMAARKLGLSRQGLYKKIARYKMVDLVGDRPAKNGGMA